MVPGLSVTGQVRVVLVQLFRLHKRTICQDELLWRLTLSAFVALGDRDFLVTSKFQLLLGLEHK